MTLRTVVADRLALALLDSQEVDNRRPKHHHEQQRGENSAAGPECNVPENIQRTDLIAKIDELIEHAVKTFPL
jgi:hypothetical protein